MKNAELILYLRIPNRLIKKIKMKYHSTNIFCPNWMVTLAINANAAAFIPINILENVLDCLSLENSGANIRTSRNDGKKIPTVATKAPGIPKSKYPIKVAVVNTGPGVNSPTDMASII